MPPRKPKRKRGAQPDNSNAQKHGFYAAPARPLTSIEDIVQDAQARQAQLSAYIDQIITNPQDHELEEILSMFKLHGQNASRLGRLLRDQRALSGQSAAGLEAAIAAALDELATEIGRPL